MMIAIPEDEWAVFHGLTAVTFGRVLLDLAAGVRLSSYRKQVRGPKRPQPKRESGAKVKHVSTAKLLGKEERQYITPPSEPCRHEGYGTASPLAVIGPQPAASLIPDDPPRSPGPGRTDSLPRSQSRCRGS